MPATPDPSAPTHGTLTRALDASPLRAAITAMTRAPEPELLPALLEQARLAPEADAAASTLARRLAQSLRERGSEGGRAGLVQSLLQEFALSSEEGVALMCLAEALLRIPDAATRDALIRDKIGSADWESHLGRSPSLFVNAATWGLLLTGRLVATHSDTGLGASLKRIVGRGGEPLIRKGVDLAMRMMGEQFVTGETIEQALMRSREREAQGFRYSYDMLGEAALTADDALRYMSAYEHAIHSIGAASAGRGIIDGPGISIKLSALHPRYSRAQIERVHAEAYPRLLHLAQLAQRFDVGINIDAEEADRLEVSLDLLERLCSEPALAGWNGIGFVIQAYQKRCPALAEYLIDLARRSRHRLMIRLVKGAYWDSEIKRAQVDGLIDYPVYTRKAYTDVAFVACAKRLLAVPDAVYPQFATHNARTLATIHELAGQNFYAGQYEFQCLHGMGEPLYEQVVGKQSEGKLGRPCRVYAPVGTHETLLAYLVRRLLENGANTSFVNRVANDAVSIDELVHDPVQLIEQMALQEGRVGLPHPSIPLPCALYGAARANSRGLDLADEASLSMLGRALADGSSERWAAVPLLAPPVEGSVDGPDAGSTEGLLAASIDELRHRAHAALEILNPADQRDVVGHVQEASSADVQAALAAAAQFAPAWAATSPALRAQELDAAAQLFESELEPLIGLLQREAGKTCANAVSEVREAADFLRYYAAQVRASFDNATHVPLGPVACISPWNFPLAIFTGQVAAALAAGNTVLAKPAEQTPLIAAHAVRLLWGAGVPQGALQLLPGRGETVGAALVADARVQGVLFTGSTTVARLIQGTLARRHGLLDHTVTLIAETGGQNAMIVDSSALPEQVVADVLTSAFDSAGQRCSALRVLCVQREAAPRILEMLEGALHELRMGPSHTLAVDVGPVIDADAQAGIERHIALMRANGRRVVQPLDPDPQATQHGTFVAPTLIELDSVSELRQEVFGPVLHVVRYERERLGALLAQIAATGYGLTLGVHTRIDETIAQVVAQARAGNMYVNRNMVGAVVGVQPFGGEGLSGTGPKAGGPLYLLRLLAHRPGDAALRCVAACGRVASPALLRGVQFGAGDPAAARRSTEPPRNKDPALVALQDWAAERHGPERTALAQLCERFAAQSPVGPARAMPGPTGEANLYVVLPREAVLCLAETDADRLVQLAAVLAVGSRAVWPVHAQALYAELPEAARERITLALDWSHAAVAYDVVLHHGSAESLRAVAAKLAQRPGAIVGVEGLAPGETEIALERLIVERSLSVNTAAAGGNATLMAIG